MLPDQEAGRGQSEGGRCGEGCSVQGFAALTGPRGWERTSETCLEAICLTLPMVEVVSQDCFNSSLRRRNI